MWHRPIDDPLAYSYSVHPLTSIHRLVPLARFVAAAYPMRADVQHCVVHKMRNTFPKIRVQDKVEVMADLKTIYNAADINLAHQAFEAVKTKWGKKYPKEIASWEKQLPTLLTVYKYPDKIKEAIYTSNAIERTMKEIRKRLRPMNSLPNMDAVEKIVYLFSFDYNERWSQRVVRGFGDAETKHRLQEIFQERYEPKKSVDEEDAA